MFSFQTKLSMARAVLTKNSPFYIQYYINSRCNLMCKQCNIVESNSDVREATLDEVKLIADNLRRIGAGVVLLTGGEPFLREDLPEMVKIFLERGLDVRLQTAGMSVATPRRLQACVDAGARDINVSLDSLWPSRQEYVNSVPGSWHTAIRAISDISRIFPPSGSICSFGCVLSRFNYAEVPGILKLVSRIGWHLSLVPAHITELSDPMGFRSYDDRFRFRPEDNAELDGVFDRLVAMKDEGFKLFDSHTFLESARSFTRTGRPTWRKGGVCDSPNLYFAIRPNGDFAICCDVRLKGRPLSLLDPDFPKTFYGAGFRERTYAQTSACSGCHYGSYPEMTLSARDPRALIERFLLSFRAERARRVPVSYEELLSLIEDIRAETPELYDLEGRPEKYNNDLILRWEDAAGRRGLMRDYARQRAEQGRLRNRWARAKEEGR